MHVVGVSGLDQTVDFKKAHFPGLSSREYRIAQGFGSAGAPEAIVAEIFFFQDVAQIAAALAGQHGDVC